MSMPERSAARTSTAPRSARRLALVGVALAAALTATGCANYEVTKPYQPAAGVQTNAPGVQVRNLMVLVNGKGTSGTLDGTLIAPSDDKLTGITASALTSDGSTGSALTVSGATATLPANQAVALGSQKTSVSGVTAGGMTTMTLNFAKAGAVTMTVPVVDAQNMDVSTDAPSAAASNAG